MCFLSFTPCIHPIREVTLVCLHLTEVKWFAPTLPTRQWQSGNLHPRWLRHTPRYTPLARQPVHICKDRGPALRVLPLERSPQSPHLTRSAMDPETSPPRPLPHRLPGVPTRAERGSEGFRTLPALLSSPPACSPPRREELWGSRFRQEKEVPSQES